ncbi:hypothetical protein [Luteolibacter sp. LG18]|uniref:hypothetical protein n=1 Tax=Luteolibacter sp. LG18 TaxID=2819286 RepID=UPI002B31DACD|nr:hypothetical protein llg_07260 [Luteolibacter sp. LG18]BCU79645.1 hypothetical protein llg_43600 [Luteolibacter sp. LG18]
MKTLACFAIPAIAVALIGTAALTAGAVLLCVESGLGILALLILAVAVVIIAKGCNALHRLFLFIESNDGPARLNRPARRIARCPIERA